jgi:hypothetical protein
MDKKEYTQKLKEVFKVMCNGSILDPVTALNISFLYTKGNVQKIKKNLFFPRLQKKQGISGVQSLPDSKCDRSYNTIFTNYNMFCADLLECLHPKVYNELLKYRNNPQIQLQILKKIGL